jgi:hypothetical protein
MIGQSVSRSGGDLDRVSGDCPGAIASGDLTRSDDRPAVPYALPVTVIASALDLYAKHSLYPDRHAAYATMATGVKYRRGQYREAAAHLRMVVEDMRSKVAIVQE